MANEKTEIMLDSIGMVYKDQGGNDVTALTNVTLDIKKGEFISLLGPSGCGKTTLLRIIAVLLHPTSGTITVGGVTPREARLAQRYGIVFQSPVLYDWRTSPSTATSRPPLSSALRPRRCAACWPLPGAQS